MVEPSKTRHFSIKTRVIWVLGFYTVCLRPSGFSEWVHNGSTATVVWGHVMVTNATSTAPGQVSGMSRDVVLPPPVEARSGIYDLSAFCTRYKLWSSRQDCFVLHDHYVDGRCMGHGRCGVPEPNLTFTIGLTRTVEGRCIMQCRKLFSLFHLKGTAYFMLTWVVVSNIFFCSVPLFVEMIQDGLKSPSNWWETCSVLQTTTPAGRLQPDCTLPCNVVPVPIILICCDSPTCFRIWDSDVTVSSLVMVFLPATAAFCAGLIKVLAPTSVSGKRSQKKRRCSRRCATVKLMNKNWRGLFYWYLPWAPFLPMQGRQEMAGVP